jgi:hypothetical protein
MCPRAARHVLIALLKDEVHPHGQRCHRNCDSVRSSFEALISKMIPQINVGVLNKPTITPKIPFVVALDDNSYAGNSSAFE